MSKNEIKYIITTVDRKQHIITANKAEEFIYDNYSFTTVLIDTNTGERINPNCVVSIRRAN